MRIEVCMSDWRQTDVEVYFLGNRPNSVTAAVGSDCAGGGETSTAFENSDSFNRQQLAIDRD